MGWATIWDAILHLNWIDVGTIALAGATAALVLETRRARTAAVRDRVEAAIHSAVYEELEDLRRWHTAEPYATEAWESRLSHADLEFRSIEELLRNVALPDDLAVYLIWIVGDSRRVVTQLSETRARTVSPADEHDEEMRWATYKDWANVYEHLQVLLCLIQVEARRRGLESTANFGDSVAWARPVDFDGFSSTRDLRVLGHDLSMRASNRRAEEAYGAPAFPGGSVYANCDVPARNRLSRKFVDAEFAEVDRGKVPGTDFTIRLNPRPRPRPPTGDHLERPGEP